MAELVDEVVPMSSNRSSSNLRSARGVIEESVGPGSVVARPDGSAGAEDDIISSAPRGARPLSDNARRMLANIDKHGTVDDTPPSADTPTAETIPSPAAAGAPAAEAVASPVATSPPAAAAAAPVDPAAEHIARADRLTEHNRRLVAELEQAKATPRAKEPSAREKALDEIERLYLDDPITAIRRLAALSTGVDDPKSKEVDDELTGLYQDLTERELSVPLDPARKATREAARTRKLLERDKRDRKAETAAAAPVAPVDDKDKQMAAVVGQRLAASKHGERYPLMMGLASELDGMAPEALLWHEIKRGVTSGELDPKAEDEQLIDIVSKQIEAHYQALADKIGKARPSTAAPATQASPATDIKAEPPGSGPRTITNASASVAPATPPAKQPEPTQQPPKYRNEKERRRALAEKHFGS